MLVFFVLLVSVLLVSFFRVAESKKTIDKNIAARVAKKKTTKKKEADYVSGELLIKFAKPLKLKVSSRKSLRAGGSLREKASAVSSLDLTGLSPGLRKVLTSLPNSRIAPAIRTATNRKRVRVKNHESFTKVYKLTFDKKIPLKVVLNKLNQSFDVEYAEPNYIFRTDFTPNDPYFLDSYPNNTDDRSSNWNPPFDYQWDLKDIRMPEAWDVTQNLLKGKMIKIAVIDSGVDYTHDELGGCTLTQVNNGSCSSILPGYNFIDHNSDPMDKAGHGTFVVGIITAKTNNGLGMASIGRELKIVPVKVFNTHGNSTLDMVASAIIYSADQGVNIINMSWGTNAPIRDVPLLREALDYAYAKGVILVAAAGNSGTNLSGFWPATYDKVISVGAVNYKNKLASFSNYGPEMDLVAPGQDIFSLRAAGTDIYCSGLVGCDSHHVIASNYYYASGTSFSAPEVVAAVALLIAKNPRLNQKLIRQMLKAGARDLGAPGYDEKYGAGLLDVNKSLLFSEGKLPPLAILSSPRQFTVVSTGKRLIVKGTAKGNKFSHYEVLISKEAAPKAWSTEGVELIDGGIKPVNKGALAYINTSVLGSGSYKIKLLVLTTDNLSSEVVVDFSIDKDLYSNFPLNLGERVESSPVVADINGDGKKDIVIVTEQGTVHVFDSQGHYLPGWPKALNFSVIFSSPAVVDLNNNGKKEIAILARGDKRLFVLDSRGRIILSHQTGSRYSTPMIGHFVNKQEEQILIWDHDTGEIEIYNRNRLLLKQKLIDSNNIDNPAAFDMNRDGLDEIVLTGKKNNQDKLFVFKLNPNKRLFEEYASVLTEGAINNNKACHPYLSAPSVADIDSDGNPEIAIGCDFDSFYIFNEQDKTNLLVFSLIGQNLKLKWKYSLFVNGYRSLNYLAPPSLASISRTSGMEVIVPVNSVRARNNVVNFKSGILRLSARGKMKKLIDYQNYEPYGSNSSAPVQGVVVGNIDRDNFSEMIVPLPNTNPGALMEGSLVLGLNSDGSLVKGWPKNVETQIYSTPIIADLNSNGKSDVVAVSLGGYVYAWKTDGLFDPPLSVGERQWREKYYNSKRRSAGFLKLSFPKSSRPILLNR